MKIKNTKLSPLEGVIYPDIIDCIAEIIVDEPFVIPR